MATLSGFLMSAKWNLERQFTIEAAKGREHNVGNQKIIDKPEQPDEQPEQFGILQLKMADRIKLVHCSGCI